MCMNYNVDPNMKTLNYSKGSFYANKMSFFHEGCQHLYLCVMSLAHLLHHYIIIFVYFPMKVTNRKFCKDKFNFSGEIIE